MVSLASSAGEAIMTLAVVLKGRAKGYKYKISKEINVLSVFIQHTVATKRRERVVFKVRAAMDIMREWGVDI